MLDGRCGVAQAEFGEAKQEVGWGEFGVGLDGLVQFFNSGGGVAGGECLLCRGEVGRARETGGAGGCDSAAKLMAAGKTKAAASRQVTEQAAILCQ